MAATIAVASVDGKEGVSDAGCLLMEVSDRLNTSGGGDLCVHVLTILARSIITMPCNF